MKLVLFDIDGTLLDSGGAGTRAIEKSFIEVLSLKNAVQSNGRTTLAGKTDIQILKEVLGKHNIPAQTRVINDILQCYLRNLRIEIKNDQKHLKPHVLKTLQWLAARPGASMGLLTGNIRDGARIKLESFGISDYFSFGAFGNDNEDRNKLLPEALARFKSLTGTEVTFSDCIVIGDTPRDIECAKPYGAYALAVATGSYPMDDLIKAGADMVLPDLRTGQEALEPLLFAQ